MSQRRDRKAGFARLLLGAGRALIVAPMLMTLVLLSAGTFVFGPAQHEKVWLKSLAMVSFDGLSPSDPGSVDDRDFDVTLHMFPNAFVWDNSPVDRRAGVVRTGPGAVGLDPMPLLVQAADSIIGPQYNVSECYPAQVPPVSHDDPRCPQTSFTPFLDAWAKSQRDFPPLRTTLTDVPLSFILYVAALAVAAMTLANEVLIARFPWQMRCRCLYMQKRCPYPKASELSREDIEAYPAHKWDRIRLLTWAVVLAYFLLPAVYDTAIPPYYASHLRFVDRYVRRVEWQFEGVDGPVTGLSMRPRQHGAYLVVLWACAAMSALSVAAIFVRWRLNRPSGRHISLDDLSALEPEVNAAASGDEVGRYAAAEGPRPDSDDDEDEVDASESRRLLDRGVPKITPTQV